MKNCERKGQEQLPFPWQKAVLTISPGLFATLGLVTSDFSAKMLVGAIFLLIFLLIGFWWNQWQIPGWGLLAAGMLISIGLVLATGLIGGLAAIIAGPSADTIVLLVLLATLIVLLRLSQKRQQFSMTAWSLLALIVLCQLVVRAKYFVFFGISLSVAEQWLNISLYAALSGLLLPVMLGVFIAKRHGQLAMIFVIGMIYVSFQILIDVNYKVSSYFGDNLWFVAYKALIPFLFTVAAPLWFLRASISQKRVGGMLALVGLAVIIDLLVVGLSYAGELPLIIWLSFVPYTLSVLLALVLVYQLIKEGQNAQPRVNPDPAVAALPPS